MHRYFSLQLLLSISSEQSSFGAHNVWLICGRDGETARENRGEDFSDALLWFFRKKGSQGSYLLNINEMR